MNDSTLYVPFVEATNPSEKVVYYIRYESNESQLAHMFKDIDRMHSARYTHDLALEESVVDLLVRYGDPKRHKKLDKTLSYQSKSAEIVKEYTIRAICEAVCNYNYYDFTRADMSPKSEKLTYFRISSFDSAEFVKDSYIPTANEKYFRQIAEWVRKYGFGARVEIDFSRTYTFDEVDERRKFPLESGIIYTYPPSIHRKASLLPMLIDLESTVERIAEKYRLMFIDDALKEGGIQAFMK